jgi:transcriptional regulator with XRE-family HTH domain
MTLAGVHRTQISQYERGEAVPGSEALAKLSRALGAGPNDLFAGMKLETEPARLVIEPLDGDAKD